MLGWNLERGNEWSRRDIHRSRLSVSRGKQRFLNQGATIGEASRKLQLQPEPEQYSSVIVRPKALFKQIVVISLKLEYTEVPKISCGLIYAKS